LKQAASNQLNNDSDGDGNMFGELESDNEDDFVMPICGDEIAAYNDSPEQVEADDGIIDAFDEKKE
jgi:hypothetical protein